MFGFCSSNALYSVSHSFTIFSFDSFWYLGLISEHRCKGEQGRVCHIGVGGVASRMGELKHSAHYGLLFYNGQFHMRKLKMLFLKVSYDLKTTLNYECTIFKVFYKTN